MKTNGRSIKNSWGGNGTQVQVARKWEDRNNMSREQWKELHVSLTVNPLAYKVLTFLASWEAMTSLVGHLHRLLEVRQNAAAQLEMQMYGLELFWKNILRRRTWMLWTWHLCHCPATKVRQRTQGESKRRATGTTRARAQTPACLAPIATMSHEGSSELSSWLYCYGSLHAYQAVRLPCWRFLMMFLDSNLTWLNWLKSLANMLGVSGFVCLFSSMSTVFRCLMLWFLCILTVTFGSSRLGSSSVTIYYCSVGQLLLVCKLRLCVSFGFLCIARAVPVRLV